MKKNVFILAGGTLGHINPALCISELFNKNGFDVYFITTKKFQNNECFNRKYLKKVFYMDAVSFDRKHFFANFKNIFKDISVYRKIIRLYSSYKPIFALGMGGSISTIGLLAANRRKIKTALHEQNIIFGLGNKLVVNKVNLVLTSFDIKYKYRYMFVGNPLISDAFTKRKEINNNNVLVFGGSNGSKIMNYFIINNLSILYNKYNIERVFLITGNKYFDEINDYIIKNNIKITLIKETNNIDYYYNNSFLVISRGGAGALSEIIGYKKLALVIPSPNVTCNHQLKNSMYYWEKGCIELLKEENLTKENFSNAINNLIKNELFYYKNIDKNCTPFCKYIMFDMILKEIIRGENY